LEQSLPQLPEDALTDYIAPAENFPHVNRGGADKSGEEVCHAVSFGVFLPVACRRRLFDIILLLFPGAIFC